VTETKSEVPLEASTPAAPLESILCKETLQQRPTRHPDYEKENRALGRVMSALADSPGTIFQALAETILEVTQSDSAGLSLLTKDGSTPDVGGQRFYWPAIAGMWKPHVGGGTPRNFGPCGDVLDCNSTMLFTHWERRYPYLGSAIPFAEEGLLVPFYVDGKAVGTIWGIMHSDRRKFDAEDSRILVSLAKFASSAYQARMHIEDLKTEVAQREKAEEEIRRLANGLEAKLNLYGRRKDGTEFPVEISLSPLEPEEGTLISAAVRDLTERKRAEQELIALRDELAAELTAMTRLHELSTRLLEINELQPLLEEILDAAIAFQNADFGNIQLLNPKTQALEIVAQRGFHRDFLEYFASVREPASACGRALQFRKRVIIEDVNTDPAFARHRGIAASSGFRAVQSTPLFNRSGEFLGMLSTHFRRPHRPPSRDLRFTDLCAAHAADVIDRKRLDEARRQTELALASTQAKLAHVTRVMTLGTMTASIAHELNQPLSGIITNAITCQRLLGNMPPNIDAALETVRRTIRDANRASEVIARLRALFSKRNAVAELVNLNEATREVIALSSTELKRNNVIVRADLAEGLPLVTGDRVQLQQVVLNLLQNAADAMSAVDDRPRELVIRTKWDGREHVRLSVKDVGIGFEPQAASRLFEDFYTTKNNGMGIGLSVSKSIIGSHHGRLWAETNYGPGATFSFSIPCMHESQIHRICAKSPN
jgi:C4-dicarboxylate-specific signal transduction histidine kinase